jgi:hypothetical protein
MQVRRRDADIVVRGGVADFGQGVADKCVTGGRRRSQSPAFNFLRSYFRKSFRFRQRKSPLCHCYNRHNPTDSRTHFLRIHKN